MAVSPRGDRALVATADRELSWWNLEEGSCLWRHRTHWRVDGLSLEPGGERYASLSNDHRVRVANLESNTELAAFEADMAISAPHWGLDCVSTVTADGKLVVAQLPKKRST